MRAFGSKTFLVAVACLVTLMAAEARAEKKIGILLFSDEPRYDDAKNGIVEQLKKEGFSEPAVRFTIENAKGNKAKAAELTRKLVAMNPDLFMPIGTNSALAVTREVKETPVVFSMVFDPVESKIAQGWKSSGNNTTGTSAKVPLSKVLRTLVELRPVKRLAVLYTPGEKNTELHLKELQSLQGEFQIKIIPVPLSKKEDIALILPELTHTADAIFLSGSSIVATSVTYIADTAAKAGIATVTLLDDLVKEGVLLGVCANSKEVGRLAGKKAAKVLKGAKPSSIPVETLSKFDLIINMRTAKASKIQIAPSLLKTAVKVGE